MQSTSPRACSNILLVAPQGDAVLTLVHRFSASVVMEVTYGYDMKGGETFVTSMQRAADIFFAVATPEIFALCTALPFGGLLPFDLVPPFLFLFYMRTMQ
jgi:hypothetical protein